MWVSTTKSTDSGGKPASVRPASNRSMRAAASGVVRSASSNASHGSTTKRAPGVSMAIADVPSRSSNASVMKEGDNQDACERSTAVVASSCGTTSSKSSSGTRVMTESLTVHCCGTCAT